MFPVVDACCLWRPLDFLSGATSGLKCGFELNVSTNEAKKVQSLRIFFCMPFHPVKHAHLSFPAVSWDYFSSVLDYLQSYPLINRGS